MNGRSCRKAPKTKPGFVEAQKWDLGSQNCRDGIWDPGSPPFVGRAAGGDAAPRSGTEAPIRGVSFLRCGRGGLGVRGGGAGTGGGGRDTKSEKLRLGRGETAMEEGRRNGEEG